LELLTAFMAEFMCIFPTHQLAAANITLSLLTGQPERQRK
jgi:hypothetical protein